MYEEKKNIASKKLSKNEKGDKRYKHIINKNKIR